MSDASFEHIRVDGPRIRCTCGALMGEGTRYGGWGDWRCPHCRRPWCQDCGAPIDENSGQCMAYEASQVDQVRLDL